MDVRGIAAIAYGLLAMVGGIIGYRQAQSQMSLLSGIGSGSLLLLGGVAQIQRLPWGLPLSVGVSLLLLVVFTVRLVKTRKFMPAGIMLLAGIAALAAMLLGFT